VFNEINARKLKRDEYNVFKDFFNNPIFISIMIAVIVVQLLIVEFGGIALRCSPLTMKENLTCIVIGLLPLVSGFLLKLIPDGIWRSIALFDDTLVQEDDPEE
jgi:Ca2+ transporting ATPase